MLSNMTIKKLLKAILKSFKEYLHFISFIIITMEFLKYTFAPFLRLMKKVHILLVYTSLVEWSIRTSDSEVQHV